MDVRIASDRDKGRWNRFVDQEGGSFHLYFEWKYYYEGNSKKHRFIPLIIEDNSSELLGIFPIEENLRLIYGFLTSLPLGVSGGYLVRGDLSEYDKNQIIGSFLHYINTNYGGSRSSCTIKEQLSFSGESPSPTQVLLDYGYQLFDNTESGYPCTFILELGKPFEEKIWMGHWSKTFRKRIRHVRKSGIEVIIDHDLAYIDEFIEMQLRSYEKFGHFPGKENISSLFSIFKSKVKLFISLLDSKPVSGALCYYTPSTVHCSMAPYTPKATEYLTNTLPVCASIRDACENGYKFYDMGRTDTQEIAHHKEKFNATRIPLRIYTKEFSHFKTVTNTTYDQIKRLGKKLGGLSKK